MDADVACAICGSTAEGPPTLLCNGCNSGARVARLRPPLTEVPEGQWFCSLCSAPELATPVADAPPP
eukprot:11556182-Alexandrium_andersonii.AAC.1